LPANNAWRQAGIDFAQPPIRTELRTLRWANPAARRAGSFVLVDVPPSSTVHATAKDEVFLRVGDENRRLTFGQRTELHFDKGQAQYDATAPFATTVEDLDPDAVAASCAPSAPPTAPGSCPDAASSTAEAGQPRRGSSCSAGCRRRGSRAPACGCFATRASNGVRGAACR